MAPKLAPSVAGSIPGACNASPNISNGRGQVDGAKVGTQHLWRHISDVHGQVLAACYLPGAPSLAACSAAIACQLLMRWSK